MDSTDFSVLKTCIDWLQAGRRVALATVAETWGSSPRPVGSWLAIRDDGQVVGSVSGGCVEDDLISRVRNEIFTKSSPEFVVYGVSKQEAARFGLPCGGTLRIVVEPNPSLEGLTQLVEKIQAKQITLRRLNLRTGQFDLMDGSRKSAFQCDDQFMLAVYGPRWRIVIIGAGQLSQYLAQMGLALDYEIIVIDPREEFADGMNIAGVQFETGMPDDVIVLLGIDDNTAILALTHDPKLDDMGLLEALKSPAFYIGALGSRVNTAKRKERLALFDLTPQQINKLHGPVGMFIGAKTPPEIAVSILAEITAAKHGVRVKQKRDAVESELNTRSFYVDAAAA
jgi:xanthine dehydrogenase accessory factor